MKQVEVVTYNVYSTREPPDMISNPNAAAMHQKAQTDILLAVALPPSLALPTSTTSAHTWHAAHTTHHLHQGAHVRHTSPSHATERG